MKKHFLLITIFSFILLLHIAAVAIFFSCTGKQDPAGDKSQDSASSGDAKAPEIKQAKYFRYGNAVNGNIAALALSAKARSGILVDLQTRRVLWSKGPRKAVPIASMSKMMTVLLALEAIKKRDGLSLQSKVKVSRAASRVRGMRVSLDPRETFTLRELITAAMIRSANDAAYQIAEFVGGSVKHFVTMMNTRARELRMAGTRFSNPHGLPERKFNSNNFSCAEGMVLLAEELMTHALARELAGTRQAYFRPKNSKKCVILNNTNKLITTCKGVFGVKTGYIRVAGFCVTFMCNRNKRVLAGCVTGFRSSKERNKFVAGLLDWGYVSLGLQEPKLQLPPKKRGR